MENGAEKNFGFFFFAYHAHLSAAERIMELYFGKTANKKEEIKWVDSSADAVTIIAVG
jgi:hypothetical protein